MTALPSISMRFCTAARDAPLPRLSNLAIKSIMPDNHRSATFNRLRGMSAGANYNLKRECPSTNVRYSRSTVPKQPFRFRALWSSPQYLSGRVKHVRNSEFECELEITSRKQ